MGCASLRDTGSSNREEVGPQRSSRDTLESNVHTAVIADVGISTVVYSLKVARGTQRIITSCALSLRIDERMIELHPLRG